MNASQMLNKDRKANKTFNSSFSPNLKVPKLSYILYEMCTSEFQKWACFCIHLEWVTSPLMQSLFQTDDTKNYFAYPKTGFLCQQRLVM